MANVIHLQLARGTSEDWAKTTSALWDGEVGIDTTLHRIKVGDGKTLWADLPYYDKEEILDVLDSEDAEAGLSANKGRELFEFLRDLEISLREIDGGYAGTLESEYGRKIFSNNNGSLPDQYYEDE